MARILDHQSYTRGAGKVDSELNISNAGYFDRILRIATQGAGQTVRIVFGHAGATLEDWPHSRGWVVVATIAR
jgi:hypothetical protein